MTLQSRRILQMFAQWGQGRAPMIQTSVQFYNSVDQDLSLFGSISFKLGKLPNTIELARVAKTLDSTIHWIKHYPVDRDLSRG